MIVVVDTNIIFSALLNPEGTISDILLNSGGFFEFYAPTLIIEELLRHKSKILNLSGYSQEQLDFLFRIFFKEIQLVDKEVIRVGFSDEAEKLASDVDLFDAPFIALSLELNAPLWTGDKKLINGLLRKNFDLLINTQKMQNPRK